MTQMHPVRAAVLAATLALLATGVQAGFSGTDVFLPSVGRGTGVGGVGWYTTMWIFNPNATAANVQVFLLERDKDNSAAAPFNVTVPAGDTAVFPNTVWTLFHREVYGALRVTSNQAVVVNSRIYALDPGEPERDSAGQFFAAVPASFAITAGQSTDLLGVYQTTPTDASDYRYNFGFVETSGAAATVRVTLKDGSGATVSSKDYALLPWEQAQYQFKNEFTGVSTVNGRLTVAVVAGSGAVVAFGSRAANGSDDPSTFEMHFADALLAENAGAGTLTGVTAGAGLTGGGASGTVTLDVGAGTGIDVAANTVSVQVPLDLTSSSSFSEAIKGTTTAAESFGVSGVCTSDCAAVNGVHMPTNNHGQLGNPTAGVLGFSPTGSAVRAATGAGTAVNASATTGVAVSATSATTEWTAATIMGVNSTSGVGVQGKAAGSGWGMYAYAPEGRGIYGASAYGTGVYGYSSSSFGVYASSATGVALRAAGLTDTAVWATSTSGFAAVDARNGSGIGLYAASDTGLAGRFDGNVQVNGTLSKSSGSFKIDHPLDPANRYLLHSFVESPDMMNVYNGNVTLDAAGEAVVELPEWFEALNRDFRYQLTCIGGFAPVYVADPVADGRFRIAGGQPGLTVSWQVTGIRRDRWAEAHRVPVEVDKPAAERGTYLHPELWGGAPAPPVP